MLLVLIVFFTLRTIYDKDSIIAICGYIKNIKIYYILICLGILFVYFLLQGIYMKMILKALKYNISLRKGIFYSIVEFFFSGITPSSTGGQPVQLYYMSKDKIPMRKSYITLMLNTVYFKLILLILGIFVLVINNSYIFDSPRLIYKICFFMGFIVDLILVLLGLLLLFKMNVVEFFYKKLLIIFNKFKFLKKRFQDNDGNSNAMERYKAEIDFIKNHKLLVFITFIITFLQRLALFSIIYVIYKALGFEGFSYLELLIIQVSVQIAIEALPLPGGAGISEGMLHNIFTIIFSVQMADVGMLLVRTFTFYVPLILCGIIILIKYLYKERIKLD